MSDGPTVLSCRNLAKTYTGGPQDVPVLLHVDLDVNAGERIAIVGASGSGKSTLLHLLGGLDAPTAGDVSIEGRPFASLSEGERGRVRNRAARRAGNTLAATAIASARMFVHTTTHGSSWVGISLK